MLNISFFIAGFASISWLIYSITHFSMYSSLASANIEQSYQCILVLLIPLFIIWAIFILIKNVFSEKKTAYYLFNITQQIKKQAESIENLEQSLSLAGADVKTYRLLQEFNILISDINETLSDIMKRSNSTSSAQLEHLWSQTAGGQRWIIAKTFIEITDYQAGFSDHLQEKAYKNSLLKGSILEFYARYKALHSLLKENDYQKTFYNMVEYGSLGKVFDILAPIAQTLNTTNQPQTKPIIKQQAQKTEQKPFNLTEEPLSFPSFLSQSTEESPNEQIKTSQQTLIEDENEPVQTLRAVKEDFSPNNDEASSQEPTPEPIISNFTKTQMALRSIKQSEKTNPQEERKTPVISLDELEKEINASPENNYDEYAYPFGAWLDGKKNS